MEVFIVKTKSKEESKLLSDILRKMKIKSRQLTDEEKEDFGLIELIKEADFSKTVPRKKIMEILGRK
ncbi:MAG: hypothetical protein NT175_13990 [Bacteroidetes bacterium]|nr:hypothetical protein [Bacteroidota bacterium]